MNYAAQVRNFLLPPHAPSPHPIPIAERSTQPGDEVEDLYALLVNVKRCHPEVGAVCSGAILSNYQRARVEAVCARLGLVSLAYLWQREQQELLDEMLGAGLNAVLIKVASLGLTPTHLGKSLHELRDMLQVLQVSFFSFGFLFFLFHFVSRPSTA